MQKQILGVEATCGEGKRLSKQSIRDNISLLDEETITRIHVVVIAGHTLVKKEAKDCELGQILTKKAENTCAVNGANAFRLCYSIIFSFDKAKFLRFFATENLFRLTKTFSWTTLSVLLFFALFTKRF